MAKRLKRQKVPRTYFYCACVEVASYGLILEPELLFNVKMEQFYSDEGPDIFDIDDVVIDDYKDLLDTGYFTKKSTYSPYITLFQMIKKLEHSYIYLSCSHVIVIFRHHKHGMAITAD